MSFGCSNTSFTRNWVYGASETLLPNGKSSLHLHPSPNSPKTLNCQSFCINQMMAKEFPSDFRCPISLEIMSDPVILSSGYTFDRASIQRWLDSGKRTCPISKQLLSEHPSLIPNHALRSLISNYIKIPNSKLPKSLPSYVIEPQTLISTLSSKSLPLDSKMETLSVLSRFTQGDSVFRRRLTEAGALPVILRCVESENPEFQVKALSLLLNLSLDDDNKVGLVAEGVIERVVKVLRFGSPDCRAIAATVITSLAFVEVNKVTIGSYPDAIPALISLLIEGNGRGKKEAATALYAISSFADNRRRAIDFGAVPILMSLLDSGLERAIQVLGVLVKCKKGREEMVKFDGCVRILVWVLRNGSAKGVQYALFTLNYLCCYAEGICAEARRKGVMEICFGWLEDDDDKIRRNASTLVQTLQGIPTIR